MQFERLEMRLPLHGLAASGDVTGDGQVNVFDGNVVAAQWGTSNPVADANHDGTVNIFDINQVSSDWGKLPHGTDITKQGEHLAVLKLMPRQNATDIAIHDGDWDDPSIWYDGTVPTAGERVLVLSEVSLGSAADLEWVRVEGALALTLGTIRVGTLLGTSTARLEVTGGTVEFYGQLDAIADPFAFGVGMIWHGSADIHGEEKAPYSFSVGELAVGQTQFDVADVSGWQAGDRLVIAGTSLDPSVVQDDVRTIGAINGNIVTLDSPLAFAHKLIDGHPPVIENLTRSVTFKTADGSPDRGHVMFMHNPDVEVAYASFTGLGRTDKTRGVTSPDGLGGGLDNPIGRYALHFHRTGAAVPVSVVGNAISGSPGWGLVNHESHVNADNNVSYNVTGAHYVTETGNELGRFDGNVAVRSHGDKVRDGAFRERNGVVDFGIAGDGFWMESALVPIKNSIVVGVSGTGIFEGPGEGHSGWFDLRQAGNVYFQDAAGNPVNLAEFIAANDVGYRFYPNLLPRPNAPGSTETHLEFDTGFLPFRVENNLVYAAGSGMTIRGYRSDLDYDAQVIGNTFVGVGSGINLAYANRVNIEGNRILSGREVGDYKGWGIPHNFGSTAIHYENNTIVGWEIGIQLPVLNDIISGEISTVTGGYYDNSQANLLIQNTYSYGDNRTILIDNPTFGDSAKYNVEMSVGFFAYGIEQLYQDSWHSGNNYSIDELFTPYAFGLPQHTVMLNGQRLFFSEQAADFAFGELLSHRPYAWTDAQWDAMEGLRHNDDGSFATTADLAAEGLIVGGVPLPIGEQFHLPKIRGVFVGA